MIKTQKHGGQDNNIQVKLIEDFSVTTNLLGPNQRGLKYLEDNLLSIQHYPPQDYEPFKSNLINFIFDGQKINNKILLGNGASELIDLIIRRNESDSWRPGKSEVQFLEYERSCQLMNKEKKGYNDNSSNLMCLINPNNPTGEYLRKDKLKEFIIKNCLENCHVIVDESMQLWLGENWRQDSLVSETNWIQEMSQQKIYIYIIHSWTKIFSCTGLRYGSLLCPTQESFDSLISYQVPWTVNIMALNYLDICIQDKDYLINTWKETKSLREYQIKRINYLFPSWKCFGEDFLSWIWIQVDSEFIADIIYKLCKLNGTPVRHGKMGYQKNNFIRLAVRKRQYFDKLVDNLKSIQGLYQAKYNQDNRFPHLCLPKDLNISFKWVDSQKIRVHERFIESRHQTLYDYINTTDKYFTIPSIILCCQTFTVIDGHHRLSVLNKLGIHEIPCILINYYHNNILVNPNNTLITKDDVIKAGKDPDKFILDPKSTCHMIRDDDGCFHPIIVISPTVQILKP